MLSEIIWNQQTLGVLGSMAIPIVAIVMVFWHKIEKTRSENDLKRSMVERGMSADEIERILSARSAKF